MNPILAGGPDRPLSPVKGTKWGKEPLVRATPIADGPQPWSNVQNAN
jgi:hypothetical protein